MPTTDNDTYDTEGGQIFNLIIFANQKLILAKIMVTTHGRILYGVDLREKTGDHIVCATVTLNPINVN